jgi:hypothetical protein
MTKLAESKLDYLLEQPGYPEVPKRENLQVRSISREGDIGWLAGIIDGEGNLQATVQEKPCGNIKRPYFEPKLRITNTDVRMIKKVSEIYVSEGLVFFYALNQVSRYKDRKPTWKDQLEITISSKKSVIKALHLVMPYLVNKRRYAELMIDALEWVHAQPYRGRNSSGSNYTESAEFKELIQKLDQERKDFIEPSTTIRRAQEVLLW